jgi:hypothetical protein
MQEKQTEPDWSNSQNADLSLMGLTTGYELCSRQRLSGDLFLGAFRGMR